MSKKSKWRNFFYGEDDETYDEYEETPTPAPPVQQPPVQQTAQRPRVVKTPTKDSTNIVKLQAVQKPAQTPPKVRVFEPSSYAEVQAISDCIREEQTVVINIHLLDANQAKRVIDFIGGATYVMGATFKKVSTDVFLSSPANVEIEGDVTQLLTNQKTE